ncbi:DUF4139 domain-containing protein [Kitasatospora terrestris]|uniref:DUF4139 domain-containing protein n=1 Tax=Kitasatospora terrestris TaxID=258051 RepID=UPI0031EE4F2F
MWESSLESVVVHAVGAVCRRRTAGVVPADGRVRVSGLPRVLGAGTLRARVVDGGGRVTEARVETEARPATARELPELRTRVEALREEYEALSERRSRHRARIDEVATLRPSPPPRREDEPHRRTPAEAWLDLADFVEARLTALHARLTELDEELRLAGHALAVAEDELARASTAGPSGALASGSVAALTVAGAGAGEVVLELEYVVPGARWVPSYRLSHRRGEAEGHLVLCASVAQLTGEDWSSVRLALSTADVARRTELPRLRSVRIGRRQPAPAPSGWREPPPGLADLFAGWDAAAKSAPARPARPRRATPPPPPQPQPYGAPAGYGGTGYGTGAYGSPGYAAPGFDSPEFLGDTAGGALPAPMPMPAPPPQIAPAPAAFAGPPPAPSGAAPEVTRSARPGGRTRSAPTLAAPAGFAAAAAPPAPSGPAAPGGGGPGAAAEAPTSGPHPSTAQLDYAALTLVGPDRSAADRGRLLADAKADPAEDEALRQANALHQSLPLPARAVSPRTSAGSFDYRYDAAAPADIPSDGTWHTVTVAELPVGLRTEYVCVPSVEEAVYATLVLSNSTGHALLAGPVEVTVDGDFLLTAALPTLAPGATREVGLGQAEGIRVARRTELRESSAGMLNSTTVLDHRVRIELVNNLARPALVEVRERVPVSSESDVRIEERPGWSPPDPDTVNDPAGNPPSTRVRRVELPAGGSAVLDGGYEIRIPAGKALVGGNRRS